MIDFDIQVFFDGDCPLCMREIRMLQRRDRNHRISFVDIAAEDFDPATTGLTMQTLMDRIHGRLPDGTIIEGVDVFRHLYTAIGFRRLVAITRLPVIRHILNFAYNKFAKYRLRLTGRCTKISCDLPSMDRASKST